MIWQSNQQPHRVLKVVYQDRVTYRDPSGKTYQVEQPRVEPLLLHERLCAVRGALAFAADAVDDAEVDGLCGAAHLRRHQFGQRTEDLRSGSRVDVFAVAECVDQHRIERHMREQAQFDLGVVGDNETPAIARDERRADLAAQFRANGDVLQIGIDAGEPAGPWFHLLF